MSSPRTPSRTGYMDELELDSWSAPTPRGHNHQESLLPYCPTPRGADFHHGFGVDQDDGTQSLLPYCPTPRGTDFYHGVDVDQDGGHQGRFQVRSYPGFPSSLDLRRDSTSMRYDPSKVEDEDDLIFSPHAPLYPRVQTQHLTSAQMETYVEGTAKNLRKEKEIVGLKASNRRLEENFFDKRFSAEKELLDKKVLKGTELHEKKSAIDIATNLRMCQDKGRLENQNHLSVVWNVFLAVVAAGIGWWFLFG